MTPPVTFRDVLTRPRITQLFEHGDGPTLVVQPLRFVPIRGLRR